MKVTDILSNPKNELSLPINDIFDRKIELGPLIQFNLLQAVIEEFILRQKSMNDKINELESKISTIQNNPTDIDFLFQTTDEDILPKKEQINTNSNNFVNNINNNETTKTITTEKEKEQKKIENENIEKIDEKIENEENIENKENEENKENNENKEKNEINEKNEKNVEINQKIEEKIEKIPEKNERKRGKIESPIENITDATVNTTPNKNISTLNNITLKKIISRIEKLEIINRELAKKFLKSNTDLKNEINELQLNTLSTIKTQAKKLNDIIKESQNTLNDEQKEEQHQPENTNDNLNKLNERINDLDEKIKLNDGSIYKLKKEYISLKNLIESNSKISVENKNDLNLFTKEYTNLINNLKSNHDKEINDLKENIKTTLQENKKDLMKYCSNENSKLYDLIFDNLEKNPKFGIATDKLLSSLNNEKFIKYCDEIRQYVVKSIDDNEKYFNSLIQNLNIDLIKKDLLSIHKELNEKLMSKDLATLNNKYENVNKKLNDFYDKVDDFSGEINLCNDTCSKTVRMVEYLSGQIIKTYQQDTLSIPSYKQNKIETETKEQLIENYNNMFPNYMTKDLFREEKNRIICKITKLVEMENENYKFIQKIDDQLKYYITSNEIKNMEQAIFNLLDEFKLNISRKYVNKNDMQKNLRNLQTKFFENMEISKNFTNTEKMENCILAKKNIGNFVCASCESYIGDLKNNNLYLPWNKIPSRDEKIYRMGHGFSKMLQLVNDDLLKSAEKINNDLSIVKNNKNERNNKKLPKISSQIEFHRIQKDKNSILSNTELSNEKLNQSADNLDIKNEKEKNINFNDDSRNYMADKINLNRTKDYENLTNININDKDSKLNECEPKVIRIYKKNKFQK